MPLFIGETDDLVFERRTVPRPDAADLPVEQRRAIDVRPNKIANAIVRVQQIARHLRADDLSAEKRKWDRRIVAVLDAKRAAFNLPREVDALAIEARWRSCFQPAPLEAERLQRFGEIA